MKYETSMKRLTPLKATRRHCLMCAGDNREYVRECSDRDCPAWPYRMGRDRVKLRTIRELCLECAGSVQEVKDCTGGEDVCGLGPCPLWRFRLGSNPNITKATRQKQSQRAREREIWQSLQPSFERKNVFSGSA